MKCPADNRVGLMTSNQNCPEVDETRVIVPLAARSRAAVTNAAPAVPSQKTQPNLNFFLSMVANASCQYANIAATHAMATRNTDEAAASSIGRTTGIATRSGARSVGEPAQSNASTV